MSWWTAPRSKTKSIGRHDWKKKSFGSQFVGPPVVTRTLVSRYCLREHKAEPHFKTLPATTETGGKPSTSFPLSAFIELMGPNRFLHWILIPYNLFHDFITKSMFRFSNNIFNPYMFLILGINIIRQRESYNFNLIILFDSFYFSTSERLRRTNSKIKCAYTPTEI